MEPALLSDFVRGQIDQHPKPPLTLQAAAPRGLGFRPTPVARPPPPPAGGPPPPVPTPCEAVDAAARRVIEDAGYGEFFVHRTGHGIGVEAHEHPNIVEGNDLPLVAGHAFSVEPGIYVPGVWGARLEDIVVATDDGPDSLNLIDRGLAVVDG